MMPGRPDRRMLLAVACVVLVTLIGCGRQEDPAPTPSPATASAPAAMAPATQTAVPEGTWIAADRGNIREFVPAVGSFRAHQTTQIGSQVTGRVRDVLVDVGDRVKKDQELLRLDPVFFDIEVGQGQAKLDAAKVALADAELNYTRMKNLWERPGANQPSISRKLYDDARLKFDATTADFRLAELAVKYARQRLKESIVTAPYDAVITKRHVDAGEPVTSMPVTVLLTIQEVDTLDLEFSLPQNMLSSIKTGSPFEFEVEGIRDGKGTGKIAIIYPSIEETTRSFKCRAYIANPGLKYRPGLLAQVRVLNREIQDTVILPRKAVRQTATGWQVLVANDGHPVPRNVQVGLVTDEKVEVVGGLTPGSKVLVPSGS